jgi:hypothetical protein
VTFCGIVDELAAALSCRSPWRALPLRQPEYRR